MPPRQHLHDRDADGHPALFITFREVLRDLHGRIQAEASRRGRTDDIKVGEGGKLYGSINNQDIAEALGRRGISVDKHKIDLEQPIKSLGTYKVAIKVYSGMTSEVTIVVEPKG